jgi:hypothetical protein
MSNERRFRKGLCLVLLVTACWCASARAEAVFLPEKVSETIERDFPGGVVAGVGRERENGVNVYEVNIAYRGERLEVEVAPDGTIGEIEAKVALRDLPPSVRDFAREATRGAQAVRVERHERRGRARNGTFAPLKKPTKRYEIKFRRGGRWRSVWLDADRMTTLPSAAEAAVKAAYPEAAILHVQLEFENGGGAYEVGLGEGERTWEILIAGGGDLLEIETPIARAALPEAVRNAVEKLDPAARIAEAEEVEQRAFLRGGRAVTLKTPKRFFEIELVKDGRTAELELSADGKLLNRPRWEAEDDEEDEEDDDD